MSLGIDFKCGCSKFCSGFNSETLQAVAKTHTCKLVSAEISASGGKGAFAASAAVLSGQRRILQVDGRFAGQYLRRGFKLSFMANLSP